MEEKQKINFLERAISFVSPAWGLQRAKARLISEQVRRYQAASRGRRTKNWKTTNGSGNTELAAAGSILRSRARDLVQNNPYVSRAVKGIAANVVGAGIRPSIRSNSKNKTNKAKALWKEWGESLLCDFNDNRNFYGLQFKAMRAIVESGGVFLRQRRGEVDGTNIPLQIQLLEIDHLDTAKDGMMNGENQIRHGVEFTPEGKKVAYWMFTQHPGDNVVWRRLESVRVPAKEVIYIFNDERPGQVIGAPFGTASFTRVRDFDEYEDAQLIRQKIAACFSAFVTTAEDAATGVVNAADADGIPLERVEPGIIEYLKPGQSVDFATPPAMEGYDLYSRNIKQGIAAGFDVTYELMTNDLSGVNFSSGRMGWIELGRMVGQWQSQMIVEKMCKGVWAWFIEAAKIAGELSGNVSAEWTLPRREMIDPVKETKGKSEMVRNGFQSWQDAIREMGRDPDEVLIELQTAAELFDKAGIRPTSDPRFDPNRKQETDESETDEEKEKE